MPLYFPKVTRFEIVGPYTLKVSFEDDVEQVLDFEPVLYGAVLRPLRDPATFNTVRLDPKSGNLVWPAGGELFDLLTLHDWPIERHRLVDHVLQWEALRPLSPEALVNAAISDPLPSMRWLIGAELKARPPSDGAVTALIREYRAGRAEPWLTAYLLSCLRHDAGYDTAREILLDAPWNSGSYAGEALMRIRDLGAFDDLCDLLATAPELAGREGAASGLKEFGTRAAAPILAAAVAGHIRWQRGASLLADMMLDPDVIADLLASDDERAIRLGTEIVELSLGQLEQLEWLRRARGVLLPPLQYVLESAVVTMAPRKRKQLEEWVAGIEPEVRLGTQIRSGGQF